MFDRIKKLISSVENLGLDTQPLRDLLQDRKKDLSSIETRLANLEREVVNHPPGSQPQQVQIMIKHLKPKEESYPEFETRKIRLSTESFSDSSRNKESDSSDKMLKSTLSKMNELVEKLSQHPSATGEASQSQLLEMIEALTQKVDNIQTVSIASGATPIDPDLPKISEGFVSPLDEEEVRKISGQINVEPKKGKSLSSSLNKLRDLKR